MEYGIHRGHIGQQCLRRADIGSCLFALDVLLARLQRHAQRTVAGGIYRNADDAARNGALEIIFRGKEGRVRPAKAQRYAKALCSCRRPRQRPAHREK